MRDKVKNIIEQYKDECVFTRKIADEVSIDSAIKELQVDILRDYIR